MNVSIHKHPRSIATTKNFRKETSVGMARENNKIKLQNILYTTALLNTKWGTTTLCHKNPAITYGGGLNCWTAFLVIHIIKGSILCT